MKVCVLGSFDKALFYVFKYNCYSYSFIVVVFQSLSHVWLFAIPWTVACQPSLSFTISQSLLKLMSIESVMLSNHFILCWPLYLLPSVFPSIRIFSNKSALHIRWANYWSLWRGYKLVQPVWKMVEFPQKVKSRTTIWSSNSTYRYTSKRNENTKMKKICTPCHSSSIYSMKIT